MNNADISRMYGIRPYGSENSRSYGCRADNYTPSQMGMMMPSGSYPMNGQMQTNMSNMPMYNNMGYSQTGMQMPTQASQMPLQIMQRPIGTSQNNAFTQPGNYTQEDVENYEDISRQNMPTSQVMQNRALTTSNTTPAGTSGTVSTSGTSGTRGTGTGTGIENVVSVTGQSAEYLNGYMRTQIGKVIEVEFLVGSNNTTIRTGVLTGVGSNYILLKEEATNDTIACDFYQINFVRIFE